MPHLATALIMRPVLAVLFQAGVAHGRMVGGVTMHIKVPPLAKNIGMDRQIGPSRAVGLQSSDEPPVAVMIALHKMKIASRITAHQVVDPAEGMLHGVVRRGQRGPAEIKN